MEQQQAQALAEATTVRSEVIAVGPEQAREWLENYKDRNRPVNKKRVERYAREMIQGRWEVNGEALIFSEDGKLQNGQHRLSAIVEAATYVPLFVVHGVDRHSFATMDSGLARSANDVLRMSDIPNSQMVAAVTRTLLNYKDSYPYSTARTPAEVREAIERRPKIIDYVERHRAAIKVGQTGLGAVLLIAEEFGPPENVLKIGEFAEGVGSGENLLGNDVRLHYRNRLFSPKGVSDVRGNALTAWSWGRYALDQFLQDRPATKFTPPSPSFADIRIAPKHVVRERW